MPNESLQHSADASSDADADRLVLRHLRFGWWSLLVFLSLGIALEVLHGLKVGWYLDTTQETRRLMWTLAHAHGTLLALIHLAFAAAVRSVPALAVPRRVAASPCLIGASFLLPGGFFLGGVNTYSGDPGLGVLLVPVGALLLVAGVLRVAWALRSNRPAGAKKPVESKRDSRRRSKRR